MTDQSGAIAMWVPESITFPTNDCTYVVVHKTAGFQTAQDCAAYFQAGADGRDVSAHYVVGLDGTIVQCVPESRGAGANCCVQPGHAPFLPDTWDGKSDNGNLHTVSVEHIDPTPDNSTPVPPAQAAASFQLIRDICSRHNIPTRRATDSQGGIIGHVDIAPIDRARCPGNYPWADLWDFLGGNSLGVPNGWNDDGNTLSVNGIPVVLGFRAWVLNHPWDPGNVPLGKEYHVANVQLHNLELGSGQVQLFRDGILWYTVDKGVVYEPYVGLELKACYDRIAQLQAAIDGLKNTPPPGPPPDVKATVQQAITVLQKLV